MREIRWTAASEDHIARHHVSADEVEQVVNTRLRLVVAGPEEVEGLPTKGKVSSMAKKRLDEVAEHAETHDFTDDITERGVWETDTETDPMVTTSLRLPKSLLDWVRARADQEHTRPTALIRQWIEQRRDLGGTDLAGRIERLEDAVFHKNAS